MKKLKENKGITLVALIITIIVLLIIAAVTIMALDGENGIIRKSKQARVDYEKGKQEEEGLLSGYLSKMDEISSGESSRDNGGSTEGEKENSGDDNSGSNSTGENSEDNSSTGNNSSNNTIGTIISKTDAYVGYYADVDGNGTVDGIIYADLAIGNTGDGEWGNNR